MWTGDRGVRPGTMSARHIKNIQRNVRAPALNAAVYPSLFDV